MGSEVELLVPGAMADAGERLARDLFGAWERELSRFRPDSGLSRLNAGAGASAAVSPLLYRAVTEALRAARATGGIYDPTLLRHVSELGYHRSFAELPFTAPPGRGPAGPGGRWREIRLQPAGRRVRLPPGAGLDLGGLVKGMAVDACLDGLAALGALPALVGAGGDLAVRGRPPAGDGWLVALPEAGPEEAVVLRRGALATSSVRRRRWRQGDRVRHHLLDPRTGLPAESGLRAVSVAADLCAQAEVAAKSALILGPAAGAEFLAARGLAGLLVENGGRLHPVGPWPAPLPSGVR
jgi:thiamine biosynthesis lipoprotein